MSSFPVAGSCARSSARRTCAAFSVLAGPVAIAAVQRSIVPSVGDAAPPTGEYGITTARATFATSSHAKTIHCSFVLPTVATAPVDGFTDTSVWSMCANSAFGPPASAPASAPAPVPPESFALPESFPPPPSLPGLGVEVSGTPASGVGVDVDSVSSPHPASAVVTRPTESRRQPRRWQNASPSCPDPARARGHPPKRVRAVARPRASARSAGIPISTTAANRGGTCAAKVR